MTLRWLIAAGVLLASALAVGWKLFAMNEEHERVYGYSFPDLQDATTPAEASRILTAWNEKEGANEAVGKATRLDVFPVFEPSKH